MTLPNGGKEAWFLWQWDAGPLHGPAQGQWNKRRLAMIDSR